MTNAAGSKTRLTSTVDSRRQRWGLLVLTAFTFLFLLGSRSLNEPDEGRYTEIAREMIERNDWLVPHLWYEPHLDKPPLTYWAVALSMCLFGQNEWAVRLPLALAGLSGVGAACCFGRALGGWRVGVWSALILQSCLLYFAMARMLTTDIFLTQFIAWAVYFFWRGCRCLDGAERPAESPGQFWSWHLAGWTAVALGFLTKGPIGLLVPVVCLATLVFRRWRDHRQRRAVVDGLLVGLALFGILVAPWFWAVWRRVPRAFEFMAFGQAVGHALGTTIKNRGGSPFYFFGIAAIGLLPWTWLLGWLWRRGHWRGLDTAQKEAWLMLSVWTFFTFTLFSLTHSKLPAYILPLFPALAVLFAFRFYDLAPTGEVCPAPDWIWRLCLASPLLLLAAVPALLRLAFRVELPIWMKWQVVLSAGCALSVWGFARRIDRERYGGAIVGLGLLAQMLIVASAPLFETSFKGNQTLKPLGAAVRENYQTGDTLVCWGRLPQGLPFYARPVISVTHRPFLGGMAPGQVPFEFPGNRQRFGDLLLPDEAALERLLAGEQRVLVVGFSGTFAHFQTRLRDRPLRLIIRVGQWELLANR
jgi:4-amino-4-deoxy-L-arabinose transferase-like glycosyltransferase